MNEGGGGMGEGETPLEEVIQIKDVIKERKAERKAIAEQERQMDLQRIRDMRSTTGIDPLQLFPKEIWMKLLNELDSGDRGNMWQIHPVFRDLMMNNQIRDILFPQLVQHVDKFHEFLPNSLELRCICKSAMNSFDNWMEHKLLERIQEAEAISSSFLHCVINISHNRSDQRQILKKLLENFRNENNAAKRFFPRELSVSFQNGFDYSEDRQNSQEIWTEIKNNITSFLEKVGDHIWNFRVVLNNDAAFNNSNSECYILLQRWATLMPNLKWLELSISACGGQIVDNTVVWMHPFPHLASLQRLSFYSRYQSVEDMRTCNVLELILEANQHLKMLDIADGNNVNLSRLPVHLIQSLSLSSFTAYDGYCYRSTPLLWMHNIVNFNWPLKIITIALDFGNDEEYVSMNFVIRFLNKFPTLEKVRLKNLNRLHYMGRDGVGDDHENPGKLPYLHLPNLTDLEVKVGNPQVDDDCYFFFSLQFLFFCKKLKTLQWTLRHFALHFYDVNMSALRECLKEAEKERHGNMVDFRAGLRALYKSNIWDVFPSLDSVHVDIWDLGKSAAFKHKYKRGISTEVCQLPDF